MKPRHQATRAAIELIKRFEGFRARSAQLPDGGWTIGYGHTRTARAGKVVSEADADALLIYDVAAVVTALNEWVYSPLTQNQFDALVAFGFNIGLPNFRRSSVLRRLNEGQHLQAACAMEMWRTADFEGERIVIDALVRRRSAEMALFLTPQDGYIPVPSLIVLPRVDEQVARLAPMATTHVETPLDGAVAAMMLRTGEETREPAAASRAAAQAISDRLNALLQEVSGEPFAAEAEPAIGAVLPPVEDQPVAMPTVAELAREPVIHAQWSEEAEASEPEAPGAEHGAPKADPEPQALASDMATDVMAQAAYRLGLLGKPADPSAHFDGGHEEDRLDSDDAPVQADPALRPVMFYSRPTGSLTMRRKPKQAATEPALALMGVAGLAVAGGGVFWGVSADAAERLPLLPDPQVTGFGFALAGIAMLASSVYLLLRRLGDRDS